MPTPFVNPIGAWQRTLSLIKKLRFFLFLCFLCLFYCLYANISPAPHGELQPSDEIPGGCDDGVEACICPREAICATNISQMIYLIIAKGTIYFLYPFIIITFLTKARNLVALLQKTIFSVFIDFGDTQWIHSVGGRILGVATWIHVVFHFIRWGARGELSMLTEHITGKTGLVAISLLPLIVWPMAYEPIKKRISFETRKALHYLSWIWGLALVFHAPAVHIFWIMGIVMLIYFLDYFVGLYSRIFLVESTIFRRLGNQTVLSFRNPEGFGFNRASYVYIMLPWISQYQWHAFSVFPHPTEKNTSSLCMAAVGNWTKELHSQVARPTARPAWICGPYQSPFASAIDYDHIITIASGIGITPALSVIDKFKDTRRVNLIWTCRDPSLIEFFVNAMKFQSDAFIFIFYTGKEKLNLNCAPMNVLVFEGRPNLKKVIVSIINRIETNTLLPEEIVEDGQAFRAMDSHERGKILLHRIANEFDEDNFFEAAASVIFHVAPFTKPERDIENGETFALMDYDDNQETEESNQGIFQKVRSMDIPTNRNTEIDTSVSEREIRMREFSAPEDNRRTGVYGVSRKDFLKTTKAFFGNVFGEDEINSAFDTIDSKNDSVITKEEFMLFFNASSDGFINESVDGIDSIDFSAQNASVASIARSLKMKETDQSDFVTVQDTTKYVKKFMQLYKSDRRKVMQQYKSSRRRASLSWIDSTSSKRSLMHRQESVSNIIESINVKSLEDDENLQNLEKGEKENEKEDMLIKQIKFIMDNPEIIKTWKILYCGGSTQIVNTLEEMRKELGIDLGIEKFDW